MRKQAILRIRIITGAVLFLSLVILTRLYIVQIHQHNFYADMAERQYVHTVNDLYSRGTIYFTARDGSRVSAATVQAGYLLAIDPSRIKDAEATYQSLSTLVEIDHDSFITKANNKKRTYNEILPQLSSDDAEKIEKLGLTGVQLYRNQWRYYPGNDLSARTVGFVGFGANSNQLTGRYGLERQYDDVLLRDEDRLSVNFFAEIFSNLGSIIFDNSDSRVGDVVTSLEPTVSRVLDQQLQATQDKWHSDLTGGIIINPKTGEIYAMNAVPGFDLNDRRGVALGVFKNPLAESIYEFGSVVKALTMAAGLDSRAVTAATTYYDAGKLTFDGFTIGNYDGRGRGTVDMQEVLNQSLNTGVSFVVKQMGKEKFRDYFNALKLGEMTGIDLPNEATGLVSNLESPREIEYATASFGQGIAMTPISIVRALSTLGNGGKLVTPHIATSIEYEDGEVREIKYPEGEQIFSPETSEEISRMLTVVVDKALANGAVALPNYSVAAKTGTAQIADPVNGGYYSDRYLHSFFGYFPSYDPQFLIFLYTVEPKGVQYASHTLTDPFMEITKFLINYYDIPPDR